VFLKPTLRRVSLLAALGAMTIAATSFLLLKPQTAVISCLLGWTMLSVLIVDARTFVIPDILSLPAIPAGLVAARILEAADAAQSMVLEHLSAAALGAGMFYAIRQLYYVWRKRDGLGLGDVKLAAVAGAWTGLDGLGQVLLLACTSAMLYVLLTHLHKLRSIRGSTPVAFGVFLAPSIWLIWVSETVGLDLTFTRLLAQP
jgi:leader peptidase (prepilin peptidase)/N-methyltransferase